MKKIKLLLAAVAAMFSLSVNAQTAADFADGKYVFQNIGSGRYFGPGNSWGTQASLIEFSHYNTLAKLSNGAYTIESQVSNGGTNYYFTGSYMDGTAAEVTINEVSDGVYTMSNGTTYYGYDGSSYVLASTLTDATNPNAQWKIMAYDEAYAGASTENPVDVTYMILDSNFDRNNRNETKVADNNWTGAWTMVASNQNLCGGNNTNCCAESWRSTFTLSQTITVPNGNYKLRAQAALTDYSNAYDGANYPVVYAGSASVPFNEMDASDRGSSMTQLSASFTAGKYFTDYIEVTVTDGSLTIGVKGTRTDTWCIWDNFQLLYLGVDLTALREALQEQIDAVADLESTTTTAAYNAAKECADGIDVASLTTEEAISAASSALTEKVNAAKALQSSYARYQTVKAAALAVSENVDVAAADDEVETAITTEAVNAAVVSLREAFLAELPNVEIEEGSYIDVTAVLVDNASVRQNTNYWTIEGTQVGNYSFGKVGDEECEFYQQNFKFYQTLTLPLGTWEFGVTGFHRGGQGDFNTYFYAGEDRVLIPGVESSVVNTMAEAKTYFDNGNGKVALKFSLEEESNEVEIGIENTDTQTDKWTIFRDFTLKYYGAYVDLTMYKAAYAEAADAAVAALEDEAYVNVTGDELTALTEALDADEGETKASILAATNAIIDATTAFTAAAASYDAYVAYKAETIALFGSDFDVPAPTTAAEAVTAVQNLNIAQYDEATASYPYSLTSKIGDFSTWTGTATLGADRTDDSPNSLNWEHYSGVTHPYYEQCGNGYSNAGGWTIEYTKTTTLPAGSYVVKVAARSSAGVTSSISCTALATTISLPCAGNNTRGINTAGKASWDENDEFIRTGGIHNDPAAAVGNSGAGWQWRFLPFTLDEETEVTITFYAEASTQYQWMSIADGELLSANNIAEAVAYDEAAENVIEDVEVANVTITRNIKEGLNTVVLPFDLTTAQVVAAFGTGAEVYAYSETSEDASNVTINFTNVNTISANVPVLVKATAASTEQVFSGVQVVAADEAIVTGANIDFVGVYAPAEVAIDSYYINGGKLYKAATAHSINAFRAYLEPKTEVGEVKIAIDGITTGIQAINGIQAEQGAIFNIAGQRVARVQKGLYIIGGKKVLK